MTKSDMVHNDAIPAIAVDPETRQEYGWDDVITVEDDVDPKQCLAILIEAGTDGDAIDVERRQQFARHLDLNGFEPIVFDGRDPAAFAKTMQQIEADPEHAARTGERGTDLVRKNYTWPRIAEQLKSEYTQLLPDEQQARCCLP